jgi:hypothetical protein
MTKGESATSDVSTTKGESTANDESRAANEDKYISYY